MNCNGGRTDETPLVRERAGDNTLPIAVVRAVATAQNEDPRSLRPLGEVVDPEALETLFDQPESAAQLTFDYADHRVVVTGDAVEVY